MSCGICLSKLKEPVSVPCGHVYCTDCLTGHVSATSPDGFTSTCPSCRETFNMDTLATLTNAQLTCLPKKFHQYIVPSIRRVYIDTSRHDALRKKLAASDARVKALEADKERLMAECERHIAAAQAHAHGETRALLKAKVAEERLQSQREELEEAQDASEVAQEAMVVMKGKYDKLKRHYRALRCVLRAPPSPKMSLLMYTRRREVEPDEGPSVVGKRTSALIDLSLDEEAPISPKRLRVIRPLPRSRQSLDAPLPSSSRRGLETPRDNPRQSLGTPAAHQKAKISWWREDVEFPLGSPFHS
ncbi:hypothetical protein K438DRAFT_1559072 [Mycena galopus ATCC 62051]|nr:hypothetical protein K438DRAFT_1559072 [Mycena galopus ATCC 62051]